MDTSFNNTELARTEAQNLIECANAFAISIESLKEIKDNLIDNWEGENAEILDIQEKVNSCVEYYNDKIIPAMTKLGTGIILFSQAVDNSNAPHEVKQSKPSNNWNYSTCEIGINYISNFTNSLDKSAIESVSKIKSKLPSNLLTDVETVRNYFW